jgi:sensor histidine kinase YesM
MTFIEEFRQALQQQRRLTKHRTERLRFQLLIYALWTLGFGALFAVSAGLQRGNLGSGDWWRAQVPANLLVSLCVSTAFFAVFRGFERWAPQRWLDTITGWRDWRSALFFSGLSIACTLAGVIVGFALVDMIWSGVGLKELLRNLGFWRQFLLVSVLVSVVLTRRYRARWKEEALQARVTEAQLKLLQGQIEPHFLFNTLANVQSLIDFDPQRAKEMLERFTDYLRASLVGQLRGDTTTLAQEFAMLEAYLALMQLRMGERLRVRFELPAELGAVVLPPLLVQPLVENAIHHGLEPQIAGGQVTVSARRQDGALQIWVEDDGQGLHGPRRRGGHGVALGNIRERLQARWGPAARLDLLPREGGGTRASLQIPLTA